jgi:hypothetical protein
MASAIPTSPAITPRRAVVGELSHFRDKMKSMVATKYVISMKVSAGIMAFSARWI